LHPDAAWLNIAPFVLLSVIWAAGMTWQFRREVHRLQSEIDAFDKE
jgi:hypothetical protein